MSDARERAEQYAIHKEDTRHQCPACGEETLWQHIADDFLAGWDAAIEAAAKVAAGPDEGYLHGCECRMRIRALSRADDCEPGEQGG